ncbi:MAG TPA: hypothetical protein VF284_01615 [Rhodanobacteraceae bacterium]
MQGNQDMTLESEQSAPTPRTTAAGLEAWLSGVHAEPVAETPAVETEPVIDTDPALAFEPMAEPVPAAEPEYVGPVNLAEAIALGMATSARKMTGPDGAELVLDPEHNAYYFESTSLKPLEIILQQPADRWTPVYSDTLAKAGAANAAQPLERLRWFAGLVATPGILGRKLSRGERYKLTRWPETEREFPKHFRIAKALLKEHATADEIVSASGMPYEEVVDYMNASDAAGRLEAAASLKVEQAEPSASRTSRLMSRLNKPLFAR